MKRPFRTILANSLEVGAITGFIAGGVGALITKDQNMPPAAVEGLFIAGVGTMEGGVLSYLSGEISENDWPRVKRSLGYSSAAFAAGYYATKTFYLCLR